MVVDKVTCFIENDAGEFAVFKHPYAGIQFPAGTVEPGESPEEAAFREAWEEVALRDFASISHITTEVNRMPEDRLIVQKPSTVYARPELTSFDWAKFPRGVYVARLAEVGEWSHVEYRELTDAFEDESVTYSILGWVLSRSLSATVARHFYHCRYDGERQTGTWDTHTDNHTFSVYWSSREDLNSIVNPQREWIEHIPS